MIHGKVPLVQKKKCGGEKKIEKSRKSEKKKN
jgi:hypothetical protein